MLPPSLVTVMLLLFLIVAPVAMGADRQWWCEQHHDAGFHVRCEPLPGSAVVDDGEARAWWVPLLSPPLDVDHVLVLLRSVLCRGEASCRVHYGARRAGILPVAMETRPAR